MKNTRTAFFVLATIMVVGVACSDTSSSTRNGDENLGDLSNETSSEATEASDDTEAETEIENETETATDIEAETSTGDSETETVDETETLNDQDSESNSETESGGSTGDTESETILDTGTSSSSLVDCSNLTDVIDPTDIPCIMGYVVLAGKVDESTICEAYEITSHSYDQFSPPHEFSGAFAESGEFYATWNDDIYHSGTGVIDGYIVFPGGSVLAGNTINSGSGSVLQAPGIFGYDYRLIFRRMSDDGTGSSLTGELGICATP